MAAFAATRTLRFYDPTNVTLDGLHKRAGYTGQTVTVGSNTIDVPESALRKLYGRPQFEIFGTTDTNTAAASSPVLNLTSNGVIFPANTTRTITMQVDAFNGSSRYKWLQQQTVLGSATAPALLGTLQFLTNCQATYQATTAGTTTVEVAAGCKAPGWWDGAAPVAGAVSSNDLAISWLGASSPAGAILSPYMEVSNAAASAAESRVFTCVNTLATGISTFTISDVATPTLQDFTASTEIHANALVFPPMEAPLLVDTSPAPDEIFIGALGLSADVVTWQIRVFVGDLEDRGPLV